MDSLIDFNPVCFCKVNSQRTRVFAAAGRLLEKRHTNLPPESVVQSSFSNSNA